MEERQQAQPPRKGVECLRVSDGYVVIIDQFMLGNEQFLAELSRDSESEDKDEISKNGLMEAVEKYGGCILDLPVGTYGVYRDPMETIMVLYPREGDAEDRDPEAEQEVEFDLDAVLSNRETLSSQSRVFVDTRCLVFVDSSLFSDEALLERYRELRQSGRDKKARDLLREKGGAVRYGFNRYGDELGVYSLEEQGVIALWPDVIEKNASVE